MVKLWTYTTIDCPTEKVDEAFEFLKKAFWNIWGVVRKVRNEHDMLVYPSFEVDLPYWVDWDMWDEESEDEDFFNFVQKANEIEREYNEKFQVYL